MIAHGKTLHFDRLANLVATLHTAIIAFFLVGWLLPSPLAWWAVLLGGVGLQVVWLTLKNQCPLTMLETYLRQEAVQRGSGSEPMDLDANGSANDKPPHFVANLMAKCLGRDISPFAGDVVVYLVLYASMALSALRLFG